MQKKTVFLIGICIVSTYLMCQQVGNSLVIKTKKPTASKAVCKENAVDELSGMLQELPSYIKQIAELQEVLMDKVLSYIEGQKNCFWTHASGEQLDTCVTQARQTRAQLRAIEAQLRAFIGYVQKLDLMVQKKSEISAKK